MHHSSACTKYRHKLTAFSARLAPQLAHHQAPTILPARRLHLHGLSAQAAFPKAPLPRRGPPIRIQGSRKHGFATDSVPVAQTSTIDWKGVSRPRPEDRPKPWLRSSAVWKAETVRIAARYDDSSPPSQDESPPAKEETSLFEEEETPSSRLLAEHSSIEAWKDVWRDSDDWARAAQWPEQALLFLRDESPRSLEFLLVTLSHPLPDPYKLADFLDIVACYMACEKDLSRRRSLMCKLYQAVCLVLRKYDVSFPLSQRTMRLLSAHIHARAVLRLVSALRRCDVRLQAGTLDAARLVSTVKKYSRSSKRSTQVLPVLAVIAADDSLRGHLQALSWPLLQNAVRKGTTQTSAMVQALSRIGVSFDVRHFNILLTQASNSGDYDRAWRLFERMQQHRIAPDSVTYLVLCRLCRRTSDLIGFRSVYRLFRERYTRDPTLAIEDRTLVELLYCFSAFSGHRRAQAFTSPLSLYLQHFEIQPLLDLGMLAAMPARDAHATQYRTLFLPAGPPARGPRRIPSASVLAVMLHIFVRSQAHAAPAAKVFRALKSRWEARDPLLVPLACTPFTFHAFLHRSRRKEQPHFWPAVLAAMSYPFDAVPPALALPLSLQDLAPALPADAAPPIPLVLSRLPVNRETGAPAYPCTPDARAWTLVLNLHKQARRPDRAARVLAHMEASGMRVNGVAWNTLVAAHARAREPEAAIAAMEAMQRAGHEWDTFTQRAVLGRRAGRWGVARPGLGARVRGGGMATEMARDPVYGLFRVGEQPGGGGGGGGE